MQRLHGLSHLVVIFQKAQSHISMMFVCSLQKAYLGEVEHVQEVYGLPEASTDHDLPKDGSLTGR